MELLPTDAQVSVLEDIEQVLQIPHLAQELLCSEKTPTLSIALPAYDLLLSAWKALQKKIPFLAPYIDVGIKTIEEYIALSRKSKIYVFAMCMYYIHFIPNIVTKSNQYSIRRSKHPG